MIPDHNNVYGHIAAPRGLGTILPIMQPLATSQLRRESGGLTEQRLLQNEPNSPKAESARFKVGL